MLDQRKLDELLKDGYKIQQVNIYFSSDYYCQSENVKQLYEAQKMTIHINTLRDFSMMAIVFNNFIFDLLEEKLYETEIQAIRICALFRKETDSGTSTEFPDCIIHSSFEFKEVDKQIVNLPWIKEI